MLDELSYETDYQRKESLTQKQIALPNSIKPRWGMLYLVGVMAFLGLVFAASLEAHHPHDAKLVLIIVIWGFYRSVAEWIRWNNRYL